MLNDDQCARLSTEFGQLVRNGKHLSRHVDEAVGLPGFSMPLLGWVDAHGPQRLRTLAEAHHLDPSVISRYVASLEDLGLVVRRPDPDDGRASLIELTGDGADALARSRAARGILIGTMLSDWPAGDVDDLIDLLRRINAATVTAMDELVGGGAAAHRVRHATGTDTSSHAPHDPHSSDNAKDRVHA